MLQGGRSRWHVARAYDAASLYAEPHVVHVGNAVDFGNVYDLARPGLSYTWGKDLIYTLAHVRR